jgi:rhamnulose-1-phosphate aldolase/alcohol dehydrogenase
MQSRYDDTEAAALRAAHAELDPLLVDRVYTSRLIGREASLVLHGGGNTSVKSEATDLLGERVEVLYIKGSGWDLATIAPAGFPAVRLDALRALARRAHLTDEHMVAAQRANLLDPYAPNPSIEAIPHAILPGRFVDHSHADAIVGLCNCAGGDALVAEVLGPDVALVPYVKPGFDLAKAALAALEAQPDCTAMVLLQHGLFTWGDTAKESYERHLALVGRAADALAQASARTGRRPAPAASPADVDAAARFATRLAPLLRGALATHGGPLLLDRRGDAALLGALAAPDAAAKAAAGPLTPDHTIRTRPLPAFLSLDPDEPDDALAARIADGLAGWRRDYEAYVADNAHRATAPLVRLDGAARVVLVPGAGLFGVGRSPGEAAAAADIGVATVQLKETAAGVGPYVGLSPGHLFDVEYWSLEQAKLAKAAHKPLAGRVAVVTGGAGAIGVGVARALRRDGAAVLLVDRDSDRLAAAEAHLGRGRDLATVTADVTDPTRLAWAFERAAATWGGVDLVVINAGVAHVAPILELDASAWQRLVDVNATGGLHTLQAGARALVRQGMGGHIVLVSTKNVAGPGRDFGAYSATKAAIHQLCRIAALELAPHGVRVNAVAPDAVFGDAHVPSGLWAEVGPARAASKGLATDDLPDHYKARNLLRAEVTADHVGRAVAFLAREETPTTGAVWPVDGGVEGAFLR